MDAQLSTSTLIRRGRSGDARAFDDLFSRLLARVRYWAHGRLSARTRSRTDTVDIVQDAALGAWRQLDRLDLSVPGALEAYVRRAVRNRIHDDWRRLERWPADASLGTDLPSTMATPLESLLTRESLARYRAALATLSSDDRDAVIARIEHGYSYEQVAEITGKPTANAARMAVVRALDRIELSMSRSHGSASDGGSGSRA
jgi:RNA polymerase sigma factor (sigma-70 family)